MTKKDLFRIILKIAGLYFIVITVFRALPSIFIFFTGTPWLTILLFVAILLVVTAIFLALTFNPDRFIDVLKLAEGFDDYKVSLRRVDFSDLLKIAIYAIGLLLIVKHLPAFIAHAFFLFKLVMKNQNDFTSQFHSEILADYVSWTIRTISFIIGYLMIYKLCFHRQRVLKKRTEKRNSRIIMNDCIFTHTHFVWITKEDVFAKQHRDIENRVYGKKNER